MLYSYLLTPWYRVLLEQLTGLQLVKKFPAFHGTQRFITALTSVRYLSLSWASPIQSIYPHPTSWRSILILSTHLRLGLPNGLLPSGFPSKTLYTPLFSPIRATCPAHLILLYFITRTILGEGYKSFSSSLRNLLHSPVTPSLLGQNILLNTPSFLSSRNVSDQVSHLYKTRGKIIVPHISWSLNFWIATWKTKGSAPNYGYQMKIGIDQSLGRLTAVLYLYTHSVTDMRETDLTNSNYCYTVIPIIWWNVLLGWRKSWCEANIKIYLKGMWYGIVVCFTLLHSLELTPTNDEQAYYVVAFVKGLNNTSE